MNALLNLRERMRGLSRYVRSVPARIAAAVGRVQRIGRFVEDVMCDVAMAQMRAAFWSDEPTAEPELVDLRQAAADLDAPGLRLIKGGLA